ncbi:MAG: PEGA domain-containing protein [Candidatus Omnitrophota bacterium]
MSVDQKIRTVLYYASVTAFLIGLPFILAFAFSYKFDRRSFKFTKTGIISIRTQPSGASVTLDKQALPDKTPMSVPELLPGRYTVTLELEGYYPYIGEIGVDAGRVARLEKIILFPLRPDIKQINRDRISFFWRDETRSSLYYVNRDENAVYRSDLEGGHFEQVCSFLPIIPPPKKWEISPDKTRLFYFNARQVGIVTMPQGKKGRDSGSAIILNFPSDVINDVFWYADSYYIILICSRRILICETRENAIPVTLVNLANRNASGFYDAHSDSLYFMDAQEAPDGNVYDNLYRLEMRNRIYPFSLPDFITLKGLEQRMNMLDRRPEERKDGKKP